MCLSKSNSFRNVVLQLLSRRPGLSLLSALVLLAAFSPNLSQSQSSEDQISKDFRAGQQAMQKGEFLRATEEFKKVLALDPTLVEAQVNLGLAYHSLSEYELAVRYLTKALNERPSLLAPNVIVGMDYMKLASPEKAIPFLQRALKLDSSNPEAHQALASCYLRQENFLGAAEEFRQLAALDPDKSQAWFKLGHEYLDLSARLAYRGARLYPESAWGHRFLGDLLFQRGRWDESANEYQKALTIDPQVKGLHTSLGEAYLDAGRLDKADVEFQAEIRLNKTSVSAWLDLAETQLAQNRPEAALASVTQAWQISPQFIVLQREFPTVAITPDTAQKLAVSIDSAADTPAKHFLLAALYAIGGEGAQAERESQQFQADVVAKQESVPTTEANVCQNNDYSACIHLLRAKKSLGDSQRLLLGNSEFAMRQYESAAKYLSEVGGISKQNAEASYWISRTYQALGADAFTQLQETYPDSWRTQQLRGEGDALKGDYNDATKEFQAALQMKPDSAELHEALGELYLDNHSEADAEKELRTAVTLDPSRSRALYLLGRLFVQQRNNDKAVPFLQSALRVQPDFAEASSLLGTALMRLGRYADAVPNLNNGAQVDHYGNVHYQLYVAYKKLGNVGLAQKALARSQDIRRSSLEHDQALIMGAPQVDAETQ
jgi:tetratricopeptide (TPR) repeat protein